MRLLCIEVALHRRYTPSRIFVASNAVLFSVVNLCFYKLQHISIILSFYKINSSNNINIERSLNVPYLLENFEYPSQKRIIFKMVEILFIIAYAEILEGFLIL